MKKAIDEYRKASLVLDKKESILNKLVEAEMKPLIVGKDKDGLYALIEKLPKHYKGLRRIYEVIVKIEYGEAV